MPGTVLLDQFAGTTDDDKLTAALQYAAAQTYIPTILLGGRSYTFAKTQPTFSGMKLSGPPQVGWQNNEISSGKFNTQRVTLNVGNGANSWLVGSSTNYDGYIGNLSFLAGNGSAQFFHHPLSAGTAYCWGWHSLDFLGFRSVFGAPTDKAAITCSTASGSWNILGGTDVQINIGGSDNDFWTDGSCNIGPSGSGNAGGKYLVVFDGLSKTNVGGLYITADAGWRALHIIGTPSYGPHLTLNGLRLEGRNAGDPSYGSLVKVDGGATLFRDTWIGYAMQNPSMYTDAVDVASVHVRSGDAIFDGVVTDRATGVSQSAPIFRVESGAGLEVEHVRTCSKGGAWTAKPVVSGAATVDGSVLLTS